MGEGRYFAQVLFRVVHCDDTNNVPRGKHTNGKVVESFCDGGGDFDEGIQHESRHKGKRELAIWSTTHTRKIIPIYYEKSSSC